MNPDFPAYTIPVEVTLPSGRVESGLIREKRALALEGTDFTFVLFHDRSEVTAVHSSRIRIVR